MIDYSTTPTGYNDLKSSALQGIAGEVLDTLADVFTIHQEPDGKHIADAIVYREFETDRHWTIAIDGNGVPAFYEIDTPDPQYITDDDYDNAITDWLTCYEIGIPLDAEYI